VREASELHSLNAEDPMLVTVLGVVTETSAVHAANANVPRSVTLPRILRVVREVQP
jgi:hypothetical protein